MQYFPLSHYQALQYPMLEGFIVEYDPEYVIDFNEVPGELSGFLEGFTAPHLFRLESDWTPQIPRTVLGFQSEFPRNYFW